MNTFASIAIGEAIEPQQPETITYQAIERHRFNSQLPDLLVTIEGNYYLSITDTQEGDKGNVSIIRSIGDEELHFNGTLVEVYTYPVGAGKEIKMQYEKRENKLMWSCLNPYANDY